MIQLGITYCASETKRRSLPMSGRALGPARCGLRYGAYGGQSVMIKVMIVTLVSLACSTRLELYRPDSENLYQAKDLVSIFGRPSVPRDIGAESNGLGGGEP